MSVPAGTEAEPTTTGVDELETLFDQSLFRTLTLNDRCDADESEAAVAQVLTPAGELLFCGHHWRLNEAKLSVFPHSVPDHESKPFTERRNKELGAPEQRDAGSAVL